MEIHYHRPAEIYKGTASGYFPTRGRGLRCWYYLRLSAHGAGTNGAYGPTAGKWFPDQEEQTVFFVPAADTLSIYATDPLSPRSPIQYLPASPTPYLLGRRYWVFGTDVARGWYCQEVDTIMPTQEEYLAIINQVPTTPF
eukprot:3786353-Rhodomonas_salina.1